MFLTLTARPATSPIYKVLTVPMLNKYLPVLAVKWFHNIERISGRRLKLKFNPEDAISILESSDPFNSDITPKIIAANAKWNIIWGQYIVELLKPVSGMQRNKWGRYLSKQFENMIVRDTAYLEQHGEEPQPEPEFELIKKGGISGLDLMAADVVANTYTDLLWGDLIDGLDNFTTFRHEYVNHYINPESPVDAETGIMAKAISLAEIQWSNDFFPWRDVSDLVAIELTYRLYYRDPAGIFGNFILAANLAGAGLPQLSSKEIIKRIAKNPDMPIEDVLT